MSTQNVHLIAIAIVITIVIHTVVPLITIVLSIVVHIIVISIVSVRVLIGTGGCSCFVEVTFVGHVNVVAYSEVILVGFVLELVIILFLSSFPFHQLLCQFLVVSQFNQPLNLIFIFFSVLFIVVVVFIIVVRVITISFLQSHFFIYLLYNIHINILINLN